MNKYLFIGGTHDGEWLGADRPTVAVSKTTYPAAVDLNPAVEVFEAEAFETETYEAQLFAGNSRRFIVYALRGISADEVVEALIKGYLTWTVKEEVT